MAFDSSRLYSQLLNTGLQGKDNPLYQVIYQLIGALGKLGTATGGTSSGGSSSVVNNYLSFQQLELSGGIDGEDGFTGPPGSAGSAGVNGLNGAVGISGLDGLDGEDGFIGSPGPVGIRGIDGVAGIPGLDGFDGLDGDIGFPGPPGPAGTNGSGGSTVPYFNPLGTNFSVPIYQQALFGMNIDNEGILTIDGFLIETDTQYSPMMCEYISSVNQTPASTAESQVIFNVPATFNNGITLVSNSILIPEPGLYEFLFTGQIGETLNGHVVVTVWYKLNGVNISYSGNQQFVDIISSTGVLIADEIFRCTAGDRITVWIAVDNATFGAGLITRVPPVGATVPSAMINVKKVGA